MYGADPDALDHLAVTFKAAAQSLRTCRETVDRQLHASSWSGPDSDDFRGLWSGLSARALESAAADLEQVGQLLHGQAEEQRTASAVGGAAQTNPDTTNRWAVIAHGTLDGLADLAFLPYWGAYTAARDLNSFGSHFGPAGSIASHILAAPLVLPEVGGLAADAAIDWVKTFVVPGYSPKDEGKDAYILGSQFGPALDKTWVHNLFNTIRIPWRVTFPGIHPDGHIDFEW